MMVGLLIHSGEVVTCKAGAQSFCRFAAKCNEIGRLFLRDRDGGWLSIMGAGEVGGVENTS